MNEEWCCDRCKARQAVKKVDIWKMPDLLCLHLKRFQYTAFRHEKLDAHVRCGLNGVDMGFATAARHGGASGSERGSGARAAAGVGAAAGGVGASAAAAGTTVVGGDGHIFDLFAVINHMGSMLGGHYTANCKFDSLSLSGSEAAAEGARAPGGGAAEGGASDSDDEASAARWLHFDDHKVTEISDEDVVTRDAYLLFFRRRQLSPHNIIGCLS